MSSPTYGAFSWIPYKDLGEQKMDNFRYSGRWLKFLEKYQKLRQLKTTNGGEIHVMLKNKMKKKHSLAVAYAQYLHESADRELLSLSWRGFSWLAVAASTQNCWLQHSRCPTSYTLATETVRNMFSIRSCHSYSNGFRLSIFMRHSFSLYICDFLPYSPWICSFERPANSLLKKPLLWNWKMRNQTRHRTTSASCHSAPCAFFCSFLFISRRPLTQVMQKKIAIYSSN